jgi:hypothetical protein
MLCATSCPPAGAAQSHSRLCMPPATTSVSALTYAASSDAKYATAAAMSPAVPSRPASVCSSIAARASSDSVSDAANFVGTYPAVGRGPSASGALDHCSCRERTGAACIHSRMPSS